MTEIKNIDDFNEYIDNLLLRTECSDLEFKSAAGGFPGSFWDTYSAFANSDGGTIILGVAEKNHTFFLDGLTSEQIDKYQRDFWNNVNNRSTISCNLLRTDDVVIGSYNGVGIMLFFIPRADRVQRPVYRTTNPYNGTYKRNYEGDYKCTEQEVKRMFADADDTSPADSRILNGYTMSDIDIEALTQYRQLFKLSSPDHPWHALSDLELLRMLGGYRKDRQTKQEGFTVAGVLMFGKTQSITDIECLPHFFPDYQEQLTEDETIRWTNRICADGSWEANLFNFFQRVLPRLQSVLPKPFQLENNIRIEETSAHVAIREALINLCIHADYSVNATLVVKHNLKGFVFSNPGTLLVSKEQYYTGGESVCRNKSLQKMFAMLGVAEKAGSGTDKIMKGWRESNWRRPIVQEQTQPDKVVLTMPMESLLSNNTKQILENKFGALISSFEHNVLSVLSIVCDEGCANNERLRYSLNLHKSEITELLKRMTQRGLLVAMGHGRGTKYFLPKQDVNIFNITTANSETSTLIVQPNSETSALIVQPNSETLNKKRLRPQDLKLLLTTVCSDWVTVEYIAKKTGKSLPYLRNVVLPKFIAEKVLEMLYPGTPNHPRQKYKVKS